MRKHYLILAAILFLTFVFRFPSLFEPFWYGDEGIFAAVGRNLNQGGVLYQTAWDNKPPMIYVTYALIFKFFGVSMFWLRLVAAVFVLATAAVIYEIAKTILTPNRALLATLIFGFLTSLRIVEGNLALTELLMILPISAAMLLAIKRNFDYLSLVVGGVLLAIASLYKQVGVFEAAALGIFLFLASKNFGEFLKKGLILAAGFLIPYAVTVGYFAPKKLVGEFIFAAYTYYQIYFGESPKYALLVNVLKFLPIVSVILYGFWKKFHKIYSSSESEGRVEKSQENSYRQASHQMVRGQARTVRDMDIFHLILLWTAFSFLGSYFSGRTYGHYLVQAIGPLAILLASISWRPAITRTQTIFALFFFIPLIFLTKLLFTDFLSGGPINQIGWWRNFVEYATQKKNVGDYNNYFDRNVESIMGVWDFLKSHDKVGKSVYIWGDWPWLYAVADLKNPVRYVTSFHVFGVPNGRQEVAAKLEGAPPEVIIKPPSSIGQFGDLEKLLGSRYTLVATVENSQIWERIK